MEIDAASQPHNDAPSYRAPSVGAANPSKPPLHCAGLEKNGLVVKQLKAQKCCERNGKVANPKRYVCAYSHVVKGQECKEQAPGKRNGISHAKPSHRIQRGNRYKWTVSYTHLTLPTKRIV